MSEYDYYESKRIEQNAVKVKLDVARIELKEAMKHKYHTDAELRNLRHKILKLEDQWLWAGYTGD